MHATHFPTSLQHPEVGWPKQAHPIGTPHIFCSVRGHQIRFEAVAYHSKMAWAWEAIPQDSAAEDAYFVPAPRMRARRVVQLSTDASGSATTHHGLKEAPRTTCRWEKQGAPDQINRWCLKCMTPTVMHFVTRRCITRHEFVYTCVYV